MLRAIASVLTGSAKRFLDHQPLLAAAALSYYTLLSIAPLLLIVVAIAGVLLGSTVVQDQVLVQMERLIGAEGAEVARTVFENAATEHANTFSLLVGTSLMLLGATTVFAQLQQALNRTWQVEATPSNAVLGFLRDRLFSFALIVSIGFLLMVSLIASAVLAALQEYLDAWIGTALFWRALNVAVSFGIATTLIAMIFKYLPDVVIAWRDVWLGALITALLFVAGKWVIGEYLGRVSVGSAFGAAGSVVVFMIWTYYASLLFLFGAEITYSQARHRGAAIEPSAHAKRAAR